MLTLQAYLLGTVPVPDAVALQRRLAYDVGGDDGSGVVILCDHPPGVAIGRHGSRAEVLLDDDELAAREWPVRWLAEGGTAMVHLPGQVACYPVLPLAPFALSPAAYVAELARLVAGVVTTFGLTPSVDLHGTAIRVAGRRLGHVGVAVRNGVTAGGVILNVHPDLPLFRAIRPTGERRPWTSLQRECRQPVRVAAVRQRLLDALTERFASRVAVFHHHPALPTRPSRHATVTAPR